MLKPVARRVGLLVGSCSIGRRSARDDEISTGEGYVQSMPLNVRNHHIWNQIPHAHPLADKQPHLRATHIVPDRLFDHVDVVAVQREGGARVDGGGGEDGLVEFGFGTLDDVAAVDAEDVVELKVAGKGGRMGDRRRDREVKGRRRGKKSQYCFWRRRGAGKGNVHPSLPKPQVRSSSRSSRSQRAT